MPKSRVIWWAPEVDHTFLSPVHFSTFLRIKVLISIDKLVTLKLKYTKNINSEFLWVNQKDEKLPDICFKSSVMGYQNRECTNTD